MNKLASLFLNSVPFPLRGHLRFNRWTYALEIVRISFESKGFEESFMLFKDFKKILKNISWKTTLYIFIDLILGNDENNFYCTVLSFNFLPLFYRMFSISNTVKTFLSGTF